MKAIQWIISALVAVVIIAAAVGGGVAGDLHVVLDGHCAAVGDIDAAAFFAAAAAKV